MKKLFVMLFWLVISAMGMAQNITLTFTAQDGRHDYLQLDSVRIANLSRGWSEMLVWPDTVLSLKNSTGVAGYSQNAAFALSQNQPNPFEEMTLVNLQLAQNEKVDLSIYDIQGRKVASLQPRLPAGQHAFQVRLAQPQTYLLTATAGKNTASIKMVHLGQGSTNRIEYAGLRMTISNVYKAKGTSENLFFEGDTMQFVGFATINGTVCQSAPITQAQSSSEKLLLSFDEAPIQKTLPEVRTLSVSGITYNSAMFYGEVLSDGNDSVTAYGVCWGLQMNPVIDSNSFKVLGRGVSSFSSKLEDLQSETFYFARAFATNSLGTVYGDNLPFKTKVAPEEPDDPRRKLIVLCEQATQTYNIYDFTTGEKVWSWNPTSNSTVSSSGYRFNNVSDAKPCYNGTCMMVVASGGAAAVVRLEDSKLLFLGNPLGNTHSIELLPGDRVVCSSTTGNTLKVYNIDPNNVTQTSPVFQMTFQNGHNVVWDKKRECLWSAGQSALYKFAYNQTTGALTEITHYDFPAGNTGAHDFVKIWNQDRYIMTTEQNTYEFDPNTNTFTSSDSFQPNDIKSVSTGPKGFRTICAVPEESWWTSHVLDYNTGEQVFERSGAKIYKARWWVWEEE